MSTLERLQRLLNTRFDGRLEAAQHAAGEACCALELQAVALGLPWTDDPETLRVWDLRALNDIPVDEAVRAEGMLPVLAAYTGSRDWPAARQARVAARLAVLTVQRLIAALPGLPADRRAQCRDAGDLAAAGWAAAQASRAAADEEARAAILAAVAAQDAAAQAVPAMAAAMAAGAAQAAAIAAGRMIAGYHEYDEYDEAAAARERIFRQACELWMEAASIES